MLCETGTQLIRKYQEATKERADARDAVLVSSGAPGSDEHLFDIKRKYSKAFVAWVTHRAVCKSCRAVYGRNDQAQFASL